MHNNLPNKLAVMHDGFNDYNLRNTTLILIYIYIIIGETEKNSNQNFKLEF